MAAGLQTQANVQSVIARGEAGFAKRRRQQATALQNRLFRGSLLPPTKSPTPATIALQVSLRINCEQEYTVVGAALFGVPAPRAMRLDLSLSHNREAQAPFGSDRRGNGRLTSMKIDIR